MNTTVKNLLLATVCVMSLAGCGENPVPVIPITYTQDPIGRYPMLQEDAPSARSLTATGRMSDGNMLA